MANKDEEHVCEKYDQLNKIIRDYCENAFKNAIITKKWTTLVTNEMSGK